MMKARHGLSTALLAFGLTAAVAFAEAPPALSIKEFDQLCKQLHVKHQLWASVPWKTSVTEARNLTARERKPIFLVVNTGNSLGYT